MSEEVRPSSHLEVPNPRQSVSSAHEYYNERNKNSPDPSYPTDWKQAQSAIDKAINVQKQQELTCSEIVTVVLASYLPWITALV
eukprot:gene3839-2235_t